MGWIGNAPSQGLFNGGQIVDGTVDTVDLKDSAVTASKLSSTAIKDKLATDQFLAVPRGTTAQRPVSPEIGYTRYNTDIGGLENYTAEGWLRVSIPVPTLTSISGTIYNGLTSTLSLTGTLFGASPGTVRFTSGATIKDVTVTPVSDTSITVVVPSEIYNLAAGSNISIKYTNYDGGVSGTVDKTSVGLPSGGTISVLNGYRMHAFLLSGNFIVPAGFASSAEYLIVAGGGGSDGYHSGGGGAGGLIEGTVSLSPGNYSIVIGAGGTTGNTGAPGNNSSAFNVSAIRGGNGLRQGATADADNDGGSGGGSSDGNNRSGTATTGQGYAGGYKNGSGPVNNGSNLNYPTCGGGGAGGAGGDDTSTSGGYGGVGKNLSAKYGTAYGQSGWFAGGGGGTSLSTLNGSATPALYGIGGQGGGGIGGYTSTPGGAPVRNSASGSANTGGGGGGYLYSNNGGGNGGSGIVIIRYPLPT